MFLKTGNNKENTDRYGLCFVSHCASDFYHVCLTFFLYRPPQAQRTGESILRGLLKAILRGLRTSLRTSTALFGLCMQFANLRASLSVVAAAGDTLPGSGLRGRRCQPISEPLWFSLGKTGASFVRMQWPRNLFQHCRYRQETCLTMKMLRQSVR
jgi:hypothetical protein